LQGGVNCLPSPVLKGRAEMGGRSPMSFKTVSNWKRERLKEEGSSSSQKVLSSVATPHKGETRINQRGQEKRAPKRR